MSFFHFLHFSENLDVTRNIADALSDYSINFVIFMVNTVKMAATLKSDSRLMGYVIKRQTLPVPALHITIKVPELQDQQGIQTIQFQQILVFGDHMYPGGVPVPVDGPFYESWAECSISCLLPSA